MTIQCPTPHHDDEVVLLGHGAGGRLTAELLDLLILPALDGDSGPMEDAALLPGYRELVISTDSFVVSPLFFPGGDIGALAVHGTVNDLAMRGAWPVALSVSLIVEEGLPLTELRAVLTSLGKAAQDAGVPVVTGDTKVVGRGAADRLFHQHHRDRAAARLLASVRRAGPPRGRGSAVRADRAARYDRAQHP